MYKIFLILLLLLPYRAQAQELLPNLPEPTSDNIQSGLRLGSKYRIANDKLLHIGACYIIGASTTSITYHYTKNKKTSILVGAASVLIVGTAKELWDINNGHSDLKDLLADVIGGTLGIITVKINF
jgi:VanZ family protein